MIRLTGAGLLVAFLIARPPSGVAHTDPAADCHAAKLAAAGQEASGGLTCHAKAARKGIAVDPA